MLYRTFKNDIKIGDKVWFNDKLALEFNPDTTPELKTEGIIAKIDYNKNTVIAKYGNNKSFLKCETNYKKLITLEKNIRVMFNNNYKHTKWPMFYPPERTKGVILNRDKFCLEVKWTNALISFVNVNDVKLTREYNGIGRHRGLKIPCSKERMGSSPITPTNKT